MTETKLMLGIVFGLPPLGMLALIAVIAILGRRSRHEQDIDK